MIKWKIICQPKNEGGFGIKILYKINSNLLCKWRWKLENVDGMCQKLVTAKYTRGLQASLNISRVIQLVGLS